MKKALVTVAVLTAVLFFVSALFAQTDDKSKVKMKPALLVIDIQNEFLPYMDEQDKKFGLEMINASIYQFRKHGFPIIRVYHTDPQWGPKAGSPGFEFPESIAIKADDPKIVKNFPSAFKKTELEKLLREKDCNTLFLCGLSAVGCVLATYHGADNLDFKVFMVKDALLSNNAEYTDMIEDICDSVTYKTIETMLDNVKSQE